MPGPFAAFKWEALLGDWEVFAQGFGMTIAVSALALCLALMLGIAFGLMGTEKNGLFRFVNRCYVELIQNTPLVIQIFFFYNGLPYIGIQLPVFWVGMLGIGIYHGAYVAEVVRAGIQSVPQGQFEAAGAQGFSYADTMRYIILPQARRLAYPPLTNLAVNLIKNTSVMAMVAGGDLMYHADSWASANLYYGPAYVVTGLLYIAICFPLATYAKHLERRMEVQAL
jgi:putative glutamine transport system permease protein